MQLKSSSSSSHSQIKLLILVASLVANLVQVFAQCPINTMTSFERISGVTVKDHLLTVLYTAPNSSSQNLSLDLARVHSASGGLFSVPITAECNNRCRRQLKCRAFLVDYARHTCYSIEHQTPTLVGGLMKTPPPIHLVSTQERTSYFEKVCLSLPALDCERAWIYERVLASHLVGHDQKLIEDVPSRLKCQEHCLNERDFRCRSGEYDYLSMQCRLSMVDRHLKPSSFRATASNVDYFENQCVSLGSQCDAFDRFEDLDLGRAEIMRSANSSDQCQQFCTQTIKAFICRSFTWDATNSRCYLNSVNTNMLGGLDRLISAPGLVFYQRNDCIDLRLDCDTSAMTLQLRTNEPFRGRMYVRDEPNACETQGRAALSSSLSIPFQSGARCATREMPSRYSSVVVVQQHPLIQRKSDRYIKLVCDFQTSNKTISSSYNVVANPWTSTALINSTLFAPKIRLRITDKFSNDVSGAKLGDELYLRIEAESESVYDMVARSVLAKSGATEESIVLIDKDGCPTDFRIFPALKKLNRRTIIGKFDAFKFSSDVVVRFQVDVQFCLNQCPSTSCDQNLLLNTNPSELTELYSNQPDSLSTTSTPRASTSSSISSSNLPIDESFQSAANQNRQASEMSQRPTKATLSSANSPNSPYKNPFGESAYFSQQQPLNSVSDLSQANSAYLTNKPIIDDLRAPSRDPQVFERQSEAKSSAQRQRTPDLSDLNEPHHQQQQRDETGKEKKRRRRSAEPIPSSPSHVPLQREIIVRGSQSVDSQPSNAQQLAGQELDSTMKRSQRTVMEGQSRGKKLSRSTQTVQEMNANNQQQVLDNGSVLCTTKHSLVLASIAFSTIQLLTVALCFLTWMHKRKDVKFKVKHPIPDRLY